MYREYLAWAMKKLFVLFLLFVASCSAPITKLTSDDILLIPVSALPDGWRQVSITHESEFGTPNVFQVQYSTDSFQNFMYWFIHYERIETAETAFDRYRGSTFTTGIGNQIQWEDRADITLQAVDQYEVGCSNVMRNDQEIRICAAQMRYNKCLIKISSHMDDVFMSVPDFYGLLEYIDSNISNIDGCG